MNRKTFFNLAFCLRAGLGRTFKKYTWTLYNCNGDVEIKNR